MLLCTACHLWAMWASWLTSGFPSFLTCKMVIISHYLTELLPRWAEHQAIMASEQCPAHRECSVEIICFLIITIYILYGNFTQRTFPKIQNLKLKLRSPSYHPHKPKSHFWRPVLDLSWNILQEKIQSKNPLLPQWPFIILAVKHPFPIFIVPQCSFGK